MLFYLTWNSHSSNTFHRVAQIFTSKPTKWKWKFAS